MFHSLGNKNPEGQEQAKGMREQITLMLLKNVITEVIPETQTYYSNVCLVSRRWRPIINLKRFNTNLDAPHLRMFAMSLVLSTVKSEENLYFQVLVHPDSGKYFRFAFKNKAYQFRLCLCHTVSHCGRLPPLSWTISVLILYMDDWLVRHPDGNLLVNHHLTSTRS